MKTLKQGIFLGFMTFTFWGILYPQFSLVEETYNYMYVEEIQQESGEEENKLGSNQEMITDMKKETQRKEKNPKQDFVEILNAQAGELQFRSKLWEIWKENSNKN